MPDVSVASTARTSCWSAGASASTGPAPRPAARAERARRRAPGGARTPPQRPDVDRLAGAGPPQGLEMPEAVGARDESRVRDGVGRACEQVGEADRLAQRSRRMASER